MRRFVIYLLMCAAILSIALAEDEDVSFGDVIRFNPQEAIEVRTEVVSDQTVEPAATPETVSSARADLIDRIVSMGHDLYVQADGKSQRAHYKGDIYVCKNFTTHLFNENRDDFCIAEFPSVKLRIPNNLPKEECRPYSYGLAWEEVDAEDGNPFYAAAEFRYDKSLSEEENFQLACDFMRQVQRGDFFQMSADYEYGVGAHSAIMLGYDAEKDEIHWMDSNMRGGKNSKGIRYGLVQYDEVRSVEWWAGTFCLKTRGATIYRLREDIAYREEVQ